MSKSDTDHTLNTCYSSKNWFAHESYPNIIVKVMIFRSETSATKTQIKMLKTSVMYLKNWMKLIYPKLLLLEISLLVTSHENGRKFIAIHKLKQTKMLEMYKTNV